MLKADQIPDEVEAVLKAACDSGQPWSVRDTLAAVLNAWPGAVWRESGVDRKIVSRRIILPLLQENANAEG